MAGCGAERGVKGDDALAVDERFGPFRRQFLIDNPALSDIPQVTARAGFFPDLGLRRLAGEDVKAAQPRGVRRARWPARIFQRLSKAPLVEVLRAPEGEDAHIEFGIVEKLVAEIGRHRQPVKHESLNIPQEVPALKGREDAAQGARIETKRRAKKDTPAS